jgi:hypothetical protein
VHHLNDEAGKGPQAVTKKLIAAPMSSLRQRRGVAVDSVDRLDEPSEGEHNHQVVRQGALQTDECKVSPGIDERKLSWSKNDLQQVDCQHKVRWSQNQPLCGMLAMLA